MATQISIWNQALSHLGHGKEVAITTENSAEANACRRFYATVRDTVLSEFPWPFTTKIADLALVEEDPTDEWAYSYTYPVDCLMDRRILSGSRNDSRQTRVPYRVVASATGTALIYTDMEDAQLEYTMKADEPTYYPADLRLAMSMLLASMIAPRVTGGDQYKLGPRALQLYDLFMQRVKARAATQGQVDEEVDAEWTRCR